MVLVIKAVKLVNPNHN